MYIVHCTMYTVQCTLYSIYCIIIVYNIYYRFYCSVLISNVYLLWNVSNLLIVNINCYFSFIHFSCPLSVSQDSVIWTYYLGSEKDSRGNGDVKVSADKTTPNSITEEHDPSCENCSR